MTATPTTTTHGARSRLPIRLVILFAGIATILMVWFYRDTLHAWVLVRGTLANDAPTLELFEDYLRRSPEPEMAILDAWNTGKIVHRQFAIRQLSAGDVNGKSLSLELEGMLLSGALDPDMNVRESALQGLRRHRHSALPALVAAQLRDPDPELRMLGLDHLKHAPLELGVTQIAPLLDDPDLRVTARAIKLLEQWSGQDFDIKLADAVEVTDPDTGLKGLRPEGVAKVRAASTRAQDWLSRRRSDFTPVRLEPPPLALASMQPVPASDFVLPTLDGRKVRLSDFRGQAVLINFWTTWCTACLAEIPALIELQKRHGEKLAILGVSLDYAPDSHGHIGGRGAGLSDRADDGHEDHAGHDHEDHDAPSLKEIRAKVSRTAKKLGINFTVLMDESNEVGGRFNGGELPTTVLVDPQGNVRRRFVGARALPVFEAMLAEIAQPQLSSAVSHP
ncbi:MAG: redoxin domain-containing protein [Verrucomicrobia bacterium]|nr:redoxin domain-containing protein [Verrucomicrobiota bacterium]